jgi:hypothetical protein
MKSINFGTTVMAEEKPSKRAIERAARARARSEIERLFASRPDNRSLPEDILFLALEGYEAGPVLPNSLINRRNKVAQKIQDEVADVLVTNGERRSLDRRKTAAATMIYQARVKKMERPSTLMVGWCDTLLFKSESVAILTSLEPVGAEEHLLQRVIQRGPLSYQSVSAVVENLSLLWPSLIELGQRRRMAGMKADVSFFISPWADGYFFADMTRLDGLAKGAAPTLIEFKSGIGVEYELPDFYAKGSDRLFVQARTFLASSEMKEHQIILRDRINAWVKRHRSIVDFLKLKGRMAADLGIIGVEDLLGVFGISKPKPEALDHALTELDYITKSNEWIDEVNFSKRNRLN